MEFKTIKVGDPRKKVIELVDESKKAIDAEWAEMRQKLLAGIENLEFPQTTLTIMNACVDIQRIMVTNLPDITLAQMSGALQQSHLHRYIEKNGGLRPGECVDDEPGSYQRKKEFH